jgi:hypothetical protein
MESIKSAISVKRVYAKCSPGLHLAAKIGAAKAIQGGMKLEDYASLALREKCERDGIDVAEYERQQLALATRPVKPKAVAGGRR